MQPFSTVELENDPRGFATLWLARPEKNNAFNALMIDELILALEQIQADADLRFLLLRGRGRHFSAGADLAWMQQSAQLDYLHNRKDAKRLSDLLYGLYHLAIPTLAVVHGSAFGGAVGLVSCCDMAIGSDDALLSLSEVRIGLAPAVISPFVVQALGERAARRYALTAERFDGRRALELGLFAHCCPPAELESQLQEWIDRLLLNSPAAMRVTKDLLLKVGDGTPSEQVRTYCEDAIARIRVSPEGQEGLQAFLQKRHPRWQAANPPKKEPY